MNKVIIGCDPDSEKSGIAIFVDGELNSLKSRDLLEIYRVFKNITDKYDCVELHIENLKGNRCSSFNWVKPKNNSIAEIEKTKRINAKISEKVGLCKQVQSEIERIEDDDEQIIISSGIKIVHQKVSKQWKDSKTGKPALERATGWKGQSNEDTRSAAWFGFVGSRK